MARAPRGSDAGDLGSGTTAQAGAFLEINYAGPSKDKRIARDLGISPGMAKLLRGGRGWTMARFDQVMQLWPGFRDFVWPPADQLAARLEQLAIGFERLAEQIGELRAELRTGSDQLRVELRADVAALRQDLQNLRT